MKQQFSVSCSRTKEANCHLVSSNDQSDSCWQTWLARSISRAWDYTTVL